MPRPRSPERSFRNFDFLDLTTAQGRAALAAIVLPANPTSRASSALLDHVYGHGGPTNPAAKTAIVEREYVDRDHSRAHHAFFTRAFIDIPRKAIRIHFFSRRFSKRSIRNLDRFRATYLGFTVVRPLRVRKAGRTVLPLAPDPTDISFVTTLASTPVNLAGFEFIAEGPPFIEQDERVSRCATAALWMATNAIADRVGLPKLSTAEITQFATRYVVGDRALPSAGLMPQQMAEALRAAGLDPVNQGFRDFDDAWSAIYSYTESGVPPLLIFRHPGGGHVVTAVGHSWSANPNPKQFSVGWDNGPPVTFYRSSSWVPSLVVHDDENGPFGKVELLERDATGRAVLVNDYGQQVADSLLATGGIPMVVEKKIRHTGDPAKRYSGVLLQILVPNPAGVTLVPAEAERKAARLIRTWFEIRHMPVPDDFVLRTYLVRSNDLKRWVRTSTMHPRLVEIYQSKSMPRWLWVTEISSVAELNRPDVDAQRIFGEIVLDATSSPWTEDFLVFHILDGQHGYLHTMLPGDRDAETAMSVGWRAVGEQPYQHLGRHPI